MSLHAPYCLHVEDGGLGDYHWPVTSVTFQLGFGPLSGQFSRGVMGRLWHWCEPVLPHKFTKVLKQTKNNSCYLKTILFYYIILHRWGVLNPQWCGSLSLGLRSPRWWRVGPQGWSGCCWAHAGRSRLRGCWACGWWPLTRTSSAAPVAPIDLWPIMVYAPQINLKEKVEIKERVYLAYH